VDLHTLRIIWFGLIAVLWVGYLVLEGFDFGVGMLLPVLGRTDTERRVLINTIGPVWDGNEVWLLTAGGATFAAFPLWYSTLFSAFYLPLLLVLVALIIRGVAFEYRGKLDEARWRARWDLAIVVGSALPSLLWGVAFANIVRGVDIATVKAGPFHVLIAALNPYGLLGGLTTLSLFALHGALFLGLKTTGDLRQRSIALATTLSIPTLIIAGAWAIWTQLAYGKTWTWAPVLLAAVALAGVVLASAALLAICYGLVEGQRYNWSTITSFITIPLVLGVGVVLLAAFLLVQRAKQANEPLIPFSLFRSRNFSLMNWVSGTVTIGMMGIFLPFTIYLQSVLGFSALRAGLTMAPASVLSIFVAPAAGRLTDKIGGKYILMLGLIFFAGGMGWVALEATTTSVWYDFLPALIVAGLGMGCVFAPMVTVAMRNIDPRMAGAASGVLNTVRQVGLVIGTAAVGALLQNRLVSAMNSQAATRSAALPPQLRGTFVAGIKHAASNGIQVGAGQNGSGIKLPTGLPARLMAELLRIGHDVFTFGYVNAMRSTMLLPIILLAVGAVSCLMLREGRRTPEPAAPDIAAEQTAPAA